MAVASAGPYASLHLAADKITMPVPHHSVFLQAGYPSCRPTNSVEAVKTVHYNDIHAVNVNENRVQHGDAIAVYSALFMQRRKRSVCFASAANGRPNPSSSCFVVHRLTTRSRNHVTDDVSVQQTIVSQQQQQGCETHTTTATNLTDCFKCFTQQERVSSTTMHQTVIHQTRLYCTTTAAPV